jgi:hypothetical protein
MADSNDDSDASVDNLLTFPTPESFALTPEEVTRLLTLCSLMYSPATSKKVAGGAMFGALYSAHAAGMTLDEVLRGVHGMWDAATPDFVRDE